MVCLGAGESLDPAVEILAQYPGHLHGDPGGHPVGGNIAAHRPKSQQRHPAAGPPDGGSVAGGHQLIDDFCQQEGEDQLQDRCGEFDGGTGGDPPGMGAQIAQHGFHSAPLFQCADNLAASPWRLYHKYRARAE